MRLVIIILLLSLQSFSQKPASKYYGLKVIDDKKEYLLYVDSSSNNAFVDLETFIPDLVFDIRYATADNFVSQQVYPYPKAYLRLPAAKGLKQAQAEFNKLGYGIKVFDAYRPYDITVKFWEISGDPDFVAVPWQGSRHNRGCAIDLTLIDLKTGEQLKMPTPYDDFTEKAHINYSQLSDEIIKNRTTLKSIMNQAGFIVYQTEWWHYDFYEWKKYPLMNLSFDQLKELSK